MVEIYAGHMKRFFKKSGIKAKCTYANDAGYRKEVWEVQDDDFKKMCEMSDEEFTALAGNDAWWRSASGCNLGDPNAKYVINGHNVVAWDVRGEVGLASRNIYLSFLDYACNHIGASQPRNVCAIAVSMAKHNNMTMGELFTKLQP